jgi:hypothetical protein
MEGEGIVDLCGWCVAVEGLIVWCLCSFGTPLLGQLLSGSWVCAATCCSIPRRHVVSIPMHV